MIKPFSRWKKIALACVATASLTSVHSLADTQPTPQPARHHFVLKGEGTKFDRGRQVGNTVGEIKLTAAQTDGRFSVMDEYWKPGFVVEPHFHTKHAEVFYIIDGEVEWTVGGETRRMGPGSLVYIPPDTVHSVKTIGNKDVHTLMLYQPGGYEDNIKRDLSLSKEEREKPEIQKKLREEGDYNPYTQK